MTSLYCQLDIIIVEALEIYKTGLGSATTAPPNLYSVQVPQHMNKFLPNNEREEYHTLKHDTFMFPNEEDQIFKQRERNPAEDDQKSLQVPSTI